MCDTQPYIVDYPVLSWTCAVTVYEARQHSAVRRSIAVPCDVLRWHVASCDATCAALWCGVRVCASHCATSITKILILLIITIILLLLLLLLLLLIIITNIHITTTTTNHTNNNNTNKHTTTNNITNNRNNHNHTHGHTQLIIINNSDTESAPTLLKGCGPGHRRILLGGTTCLANFLGLMYYIG